MEEKNLTELVVTDVKNCESKKRNFVFDLLYFIAIIMVIDDHTNV